MKVSLTTGLFGLAFLSSTPVAAASSSPDASTCCDKLYSAFPDETFTNSGSQSVKYQAILQSYFSLSLELKPSCFVQPQSAKQLSKIVPILSQGQCKFAVKGGSALVTAGVNGIAGGVTIDLARLNSVTLDTKTEIASVQGGAKWGDVYKVLNPRGYSVPGGSATNVGVGGQTLGGGLSLVTARYGFTCDNVKNVEIVLGNGTIVDASAQKNTDLFKALKGGEGNFGIATRFDFYTYKTGDLWGGATYYNYTTLEKFYKPTVDFINNLAKNPDAVLFVFWTHNATAGNQSLIVSYDYTGNATEKPYYTSTDPPNSQKPFPSPLSDFEFSKVGKPYEETLRVANQYNITYELNGANNTRFSLSNTAFRCDVETLTHVDAIAREVLRPYVDKQKPAPYVSTQLLYEALPRVFVEKSIERGGNVLGLERVKDNSIILDVLFQWDDPTKDQEILDLANTVIGKVANYTKSVPGAFRDFQYIGESNADQDPIGSYGDANLKFLKGVSQKYDADQVFQKLVPGAFTLRDAGKKGKQFSFNQFVGTGTN